MLQPELKRLVDSVTDHVESYYLHTLITLSLDIKDFFGMQRTYKKHI
jgi:hypothetical protein